MSNNKVRSIGPRLILTVMSWTLFSRILGFFRNAMISFYFGAQNKADVLYFILTIPNTLRRLAAEGSLETALVPELSRTLERDPSGARSRSLWRRLLALQLFILLPLCLTIFFFPKPIIQFLAEFPLPSQSLLAERLLRWVSPYMLMLGVSVLAGAVLSSHRLFGLTAFIPIISSLVTIAAIVVFQETAGIHSVLWGMLCGVTLQAAFLIFRIRSLDYTMKPLFQLRDPAVKRITRVWLPIWAGTGFISLMQLTANYLASQEASGSLSALTNALLFFQLPQGLLYASIAKVSLPQISGERPEHSSPELSEVAGVMRYGLINLAVLFLPATLLLCLLSREVIGTALQRGAFTVENTLMTAEVLRYYALGSLPIGIFRFLQQYLYARQKRFQPLFMIFLVSAIDISLSFLFLRYYRIGVIGLPIANSISYTVLAVYSYFIVRKEIPSLFRLSDLRLLFKMLLILSVLYLLNWLFLRYEPAEWWSQGGVWRNFLLLGAHGTALGVSFWLLCRTLKVPLLRPLKSEL